MRTTTRIPAPTGPRLLPVRRGAAGSAILLLAASLSVALGQGPAAADAPPGCGTVLLTSVKLTEDLTCTGDGLVIGADNVTVDLNGHTVSGSGTGRGIGSSDSSAGTRWTGTTVRGGTIQGFAKGMSFFGATDVKILNVTVSGGVIESDFNMSGKPSLSISGSRSRCVLDRLDLRHSRATVNHCTIKGDAWINETNLTVTGSRFTGGNLSFRQTDGNVITGNVFDGAGINLGAECRDNTIRGNVFKNTGTALYLGGSSKINAVEDNTFKDNDIGIEAIHYHETVTGNRFIRNRTAGMFLQGALPVPGTISGNLFRRNGENPSGITDAAGNLVRGGIHIGWKGDPKPVTVAGNVGVRNSGWFIWAPHDSVLDGGGNQGGPCGPPPTSEPKPPGGPQPPPLPASVTCTG
ncbi:NosD domain-containing protein [Sphaerisporangium fuscum]|uniref:NosD domain-containing protein n=1 Tax=Sphaerisporangium fuscum TaxID=2835868 RepID=UPI001BDDC1E3|nr:NosD domain-containing protein [Sphaerisporangium fuscum]